MSYIPPLLDAVVQATIDTLTQHVAGDRIAAKKFLRYIMWHVAQRDWEFILPIATRLMRHADWQEHLDVLWLIAFCEPRVGIGHWLGRVKTFDAQSEFMGGVAAQAESELWRP